MKRALSMVFVALFAASGARANAPSLNEAIVERVLGAHVRNPALRDDAFAKMGGSSVASRAFLHCFSTPYVDLGNHSSLSETIDYFDTGRRNAFNRESEASGVSWNLRYVLGGRPANFREEIRATKARWALVLFGGNDAQNKNERIYLKRLVYLVEALEDMGVVPVLGAASPRRSRTKDLWIRRFNAITEAVARHWALPYIDYYTALEALPRMGLARDGVHPNVLPPGGLQNACKLTEQGLQHGNNVRNLLTLQMLDALRRVAEASAGADAFHGSDADTHVDGGAPEDAGVDAGTSFPISFVLEKDTLSSSSSLPERCGSPQPGSRQHRTRLTLEEGARLRVSAFDLDEGHKPRVMLVRIDEDGERCVRRRLQTLEVDVPAGMWDLIVETGETITNRGRILVLIAPDRR
jgi:hypothetical protein